jgi:S1-C subfamily serine protease
MLSTLLCLAAAQPARAGLPERVAAARASVVAVGVYNPLASPRFGFRGTGFVIADANGEGRLLATNAHVLPDETAAQKELALQIGGNRVAGADAGPETRRLSVLAVDRVHDLALLQITGPPLPPLALAGEVAREGQSVFFIGFPVGGLLGFSPVTHRGIVSSITPIALPPPNARQLDAAAAARLRQGPFDIYQLDATAYPGNSGGPLFDAESGQVLGLVNMVLVKGSRESVLSQPSGISYAIPVRFLRELLAERR